VQHADERIFYALERLWKDCPVIRLPEPVTAGHGGLGQQQGPAGSPNGDTR
jgi:ribosome-associated protein